MPITDCARPDELIARAAAPQERSGWIAWGDDVVTLFYGEAIGEAVPPFALGELTDAHALECMSADPAAPWSMHRIFEPLVRHGVEHIAVQAARSDVPIGPAAHRQLLAALAQRMSGPCTSVLFYRVTLADVMGDHPGVVGQTVHEAVFGDHTPVLDQWLRLFRTYPVLSRLIAVAYRNWCDATAELITRLHHDRSRIASAFGVDRLGALTHCAMGMGDSHDRGRTVAILGFESGTRVAYKPKDLRVAGAYMRLVHQLNAAGVEPPLPTRRIIEGNAYGWEEFVGERECASLEEVRRFYFRIGMQARLVQLLDGVDFTGDNVVASGDEPALVDLEALLAPRIAVPSHTPAYDEALTRSFESPARGCLITAKILGERGRPAAELGALAPPTACISPFKQRIVRRTEAGPALVDDYPDFPAFRATPRYLGVRVDSTAYFDEVIGGYVAMGESLRQLHDLLSDAKGPLASMRDVHVRCLCRNTHTYARILQASLTPGRLRDAAEREACLGRLWKAQFPSPLVVESEIEALRDLDVPMFASRPGSRQLLKEGVVVVEDFFVDTAMERLDDRIRALPYSTRKRDRELIESVLFTLAPTVPRRFSAAPKTPSAPSVVPEWASIAEVVGHEIAATAVSASIEPTWVGANCHAASGCWMFGVINDDLYSGVAGIGLVLAEVAAATGWARLSRLASRTLRGVSQRLACERASVVADPRSHPSWAMFGSRGRLYACERGAALLGDESLREGGALLLDAVGFRALDGDASPPCYPNGFRPRGLMGDAVATWLAIERSQPGGGSLVSDLSPTSVGDVVALLMVAHPHALRFADTYLSQSIRETDGLGLVERGEVALAAHRLAPDARYLAAAEDAGERLYQLQARTGRWLPESLLADRFNGSAIVGLAAVAHFFLHLASPGGLRSYRVLE